MLFIVSVKYVPVKESRVRLALFFEAEESFTHFPREERSQYYEVSVQNEIRTGVYKHLRCKGIYC
jgi:hypothetical protein